MKIKDMTKNKVGALGLNQIPNIAMIFFFLAIILGAIGLVLNEFLGQMTVNTTAYNMVNDTLDAIAGIPTWIPILIIMVIAAIILGIVAVFKIGGDK